MVPQGHDKTAIKQLNDAVAAASKNARAAGYTPNAIAHIISTPSDVYMFSGLPEADQRAILRQASDAEFERYLTHAKMEIRAPMRQERASNRAQAAPPNSTPAPRAAAPSPPIVPAPAPAPPPRSAPPPPPRGSMRADDLLRASPLSGR